MTLETALVAELDGAAGLVALVETRIEPVLNAQSNVWPALTYQQISGPLDYSHDGPGMTYPRFQLTATATTFTQVVAVMSAARAALEGDHADFGGEGERATVFVENQFDSYAAESGETGVYVRRCDVVIWTT